jgi:multidrug efflux system membrane fusion protein
MFLKGETGGREGKQSEVEIAVSDRDQFEFKGIIDFTDNQLDRDTATLHIRALVKNENEFLTPGLFARVRVPIGKPEEQLLVRDAALGFDQDKRVAWVLNKDNTVERRFVEVGTLDGDLRVILSGLNPDDKIAVTGIQLLRPGALITPTVVPMISTVGSF